MKLLDIETRRRLEAKIVLFPLFKKLASELLKQVKSHSLDIYSSSRKFPYTYGDIEKKNFFMHTHLVLTLQRLGMYVSQEIEDLEVSRIDTRKTLAEMGDVLSAMDIDDLFIRFLIETKNLPRARKTAQDISQDYTIPEPEDMLEFGLQYYIAARFQKREFETMPPRVVSRVASNFIENGQPDEAKKLVADIDLGMYGSSHYFPALLKHYQSQGDTEAIRYLIYQLNQLANKEKEKEEGKRANHSRMLEHLSSEASQVLAQELARQGQVEEAFALLSQIDKPFFQFLRKIDLLQIILNSTEADKYPGLASQIKEQILEAKSSTQEKFNLLAELAKVIAPFPSYASLLIQIIGQENSSDQSSLLSLLPQILDEDHSNEWMKIIHLYALKKDVHKMTEVFERACTLEPQSAPNFFIELVSGLVLNDVERAYQVVQACPNLQLRALCMAKVIVAKLKHAPNISDWKQLVDQFDLLEQKILSADEIKIDEFLEESEDTDGDDLIQPRSENMLIGIGDMALFVGDEMLTENYTPELPVVLFEVAKIAVEKGEWGVFQEILDDKRMTNIFRVDLIRDVTAWISGDGPLRPYTYIA